MNVLTRVVAVCMLSAVFFFESAFAQAERWWESNKPETAYLTQLALSDSARFTHEFEYPFLLVLNDTEKNDYRSLSTLNDRKFYIRNYLKSHNENPLLPVNYWLLEFIGRYEHARREFPVDEPPYFDVRGEYYIKFGKPLRRHENKKTHYDIEFLKYVNVTKIDRSKPQLIESYFKIFQNESWYYDNDNNYFIVHFAKEGRTWKRIDRLDKVLVDRRPSKALFNWMELVKDRDNLCSHYSMLSAEIRFMEEYTKDLWLENGVTGHYLRPENISWKEISLDPSNPTSEVMNLKYYAESVEKALVVNAVPNVEVRFSELSKIDFDYDVAQFRDSDGRTLIELTFLAPVDDILGKRKYFSEPDSVLVEFRFMIRDENYEPLVNIPVGASFHRQKAKEAGLPNALTTIALPLEPVHGDLTVQVLDPVNRNKGYKKAGFDVRDFTGDSLMVSDVKLYIQPQNDLQRELLPVTKTDQYEIATYPYRDIISALPLVCYFEIYNLERSGIRSEYDIDISVTRIELNLFDRLKKLVRDANAYSTGIKRTRAIEGNKSSELFAFDISNLTNGRYVLEITVTDKDNSRITARSSKIIDITRF